MSNDAQGRGKVRKWQVAAVATAATLVMAGCSSSSGSPAASGSSGTSAAATNQPVTLTFSQWWAPEMPSGALQGLMDEFHNYAEVLVMPMLWWRPACLCWSVVWEGVARAA